MGTKVAVVLAILTVGYLEIKLYTILPDYFTEDYSKYIIERWKRFIDHCFIPWKKGENLDLFVEILDTLHRILWYSMQKMTRLKQTSFTRKKMHTDIFIFKVHTHIKSKETSPSHSLKELLDSFQ